MVVLWRKKKLKENASRKNMRERRYETRFKGEMSYADQVDDEEEQTSDSDDSTYEEVIDSDYELQLELI